MRSQPEGRLSVASHSTAHEVNFQLQSKLFNSPLEIRQQIYGYLLPRGAHLYLRQNTLCISKCFDRSRDGNFGYERRVSRFPPELCSDEVWKRRLRSTWGPHWECEELAGGLEGSRDIASEENLAFLRVCRRAYVDIVDFVIDLVPVHVTDLATLERIVEKKTTLAKKAPERKALKSSSKKAAPPSSCTRNVYLEANISRIQSLSIVLWLPLTKHKSGRRTAAISPAALRSWTQLCPAILALTNTRRLRIWIDHDGYESWTVVNERAILAPLSNRSDNSGVEITVNLPKLHPKYETPKRHFTPACASPSFVVERRLRQRKHAVPRGDGTLTVQYKADFPILYDNSDISDDDNEETLEEVERRERWLWESGDNVEARVGMLSGRNRYVYFQWHTESEESSSGEEDKDDAGYLRFLR